MKRIRFTHHELDLIIRMLCIAEAQLGNWGDGDYSSWDEDKDSSAFSSLFAKVSELYRRAK